MAPLNWTAVVNPIIQPAMRLIAGITNAHPAVITTTFAHDYETGDIVRVVVPFGWGMPQFGSRLGTITVLNDTQFTFPADTTAYDAFVVPLVEAPGLNTPAMVIPQGEVATKLTQAYRNILGGL